MLPGDGDDSEAAISAFLSRKSETVYHPVGSCRMGSGPMEKMTMKMKVDAQRVGACDGTEGADVAS